MHPQLQAWHDGFLAARAEARALTDGLDAAAFNRPPAPGVWSVGQGLAHLATVGGLLLPGLEAAVARLRLDGRTGRPPYRLGFVGGLFARSLAPGRGRLKAPAAYAPPVVLDPAGTRAAFEAVGARFAALVAGADGLALTQAKVPSPAAPLLKLNVAAWLEATLNHERRHLAQARRALP